MDKFDGVGNFNRIEVLIDPETLEYRLDFYGKYEIIKGVLRHILEKMEEPGWLEKHAEKDNDFNDSFLL